MQGSKDILSLLTSISLRVLLLDRSRRIRRFTPTAQKIQHIGSQTWPASCGSVVLGIQTSLVGALHGVDASVRTDMI